MSRKRPSDDGPPLRQREFPHAVVRQLRNLGHDVLTVAEAGNAGQRMPDEAVLAYATQSERAVLTLNRRDFVRLHRQGISHAGIIACTQDANVIGQAQRIHAVVAGAGSLANCLLRVVRPNPDPTTASTAILILRREYTWQGTQTGDLASCARHLDVLERQAPSPRRTKGPDSGRIAGRNVRYRARSAPELPLRRPSFLESF